MHKEITFIFLCISGKTYKVGYRNFQLSITLQYTSSPIQFNIYFSLPRSNTFYYYFPMIYSTNHTFYVAFTLLAAVTTYFFHIKFSSSHRQHIRWIFIIWIVENVDEMEVLFRLPVKTKIYLYYTWIIFHARMLTNIPEIPFLLLFLQFLLHVLCTYTYNKHYFGILSRKWRLLLLITIWRRRRAGKFFLFTTSTSISSHDKQ